MRGAEPRDGAFVVVVVDAGVDATVAFEPVLDAWNGQFGEADAQIARAEDRAKTETNETRAMDAGSTAATCKIAFVHAMVRQWTRVANWMLENRYSPVLYAGDTKTNLMGSCAMVHFVAPAAAVTEVQQTAAVDARAQLLGLEEGQAHCSHSVRYRCWRRGTHQRNANRQTGAADLHC